MAPNLAQPWKNSTDISAISAAFCISVRAYFEVFWIQLGAVVSLVLGAVVPLVQGKGDQELPRWWLGSGTRLDTYAKVLFATRYRSNIFARIYCANIFAVIYLHNIPGTHLDTSTTIVLLQYLHTVISYAKNAIGKKAGLRRDAKFSCVAQEWWERGEYC